MRSSLACHLSETGLASRQFKRRQGKFPLKDQLVIVRECLLKIGYCEFLIHIECVTIVIS